ncbi:MAG: 16S rRNA (cytidine(1402)-2'-O)-methyltransferase, partial [Candidatus Aureabacteria bacterium]|nr:16S rRNA (cytidine(1402)-2'-O)-methyltransferase [Candidatus Auribacterota bacterium]
MTGSLYILATPIGNLRDITLRAVEILQKADAVIAEDTRRASVLLRHHGIRAKRLFSCHKFNEKSRTEKILHLLLEGNDVAFISDSGTPGISDPGQFIVKKAHERGIKVVAVPGASALTAALSVAGVEDKGFTFIGFLGKKTKDIEEIKWLLETAGRPVVFYESPKRILKTLQKLSERLPESVIILCRELTKIHEEVLRKTP